MRPKNLLKIIHPNSTASLVRHFLPEAALRKISSSNVILTKAWIVYDTYIEDYMSRIKAKNCINKLATQGDDEVEASLGHTDIFHLVMQSEWNEFILAVGPCFAEELRTHSVIYIGYQDTFVYIFGKQYTSSVSSRFAAIKWNGANDLRTRANVKRKFEELISDGISTKGTTAKRLKVEDSLNLVMPCPKRQRSFDRRRPYDPRLAISFEYYRTSLWNKKLEWKNVIGINCNGESLFLQILSMELKGDRTVELEARDPLRKAIPLFEQLCRKLVEINLSSLVAPFAPVAAEFKEIPAITVFSFVREVFKKCSLKSVLGGNCNFQDLVDKVKKIVSRTYCEEFDIQRLMEGFKWSYCKWSSDFSPPVRHCAAAKLVVWILSRFTPFIINFFFHATRRLASYELVYYRKIAWLKNSNNNLQLMLDNSKLAKISSEEASEKMGGVCCHGTLKWSLKPDGTARMIVKVQKQRGMARLQDDALILLGAISANFQCRVPTRSDSAIIHKRWCDFRKSLEKSGAKKLHFASFDVTDAFGSIKHSVILDLLWRYYREEFEPFVGESSSVYRITVATPGKKARTRTFTVIQDVHDTTRFLEKLQKSSVIISVVKAKDLCGLEVVQYIEDCIKNIIVKCGDQFFRMVEGLPQGWVLSSALCDLYLGYFNRMHLEWPIEAGVLSIMFRGVDDYLYFSTSQDHARRMLDAVSKTYDDFGISFKNAKSSTNVDCESAGFIRENSQWASFCGLSFDTEMSGIRPNFKSFSGKPLYCTLKIKESRDTARFLIPKILRVLSTKLAWITLDPSINNLRRRRENLRDIFLATIKRFHSIVTHFLGNIRTETFLFRCVDSMLATIAARFCGFKRYRGRSPLAISSAKYLFLHIMAKFVKKYPSVYGPKVRFLTQLKKDVAKKLKRKEKLALRGAAYSVMSNDLYALVL